MSTAEELFSQICFQYSNYFIRECVRLSIKEIKAEVQSDNVQKSGRDTYTVGLIIQRLHQHHVSGLIDAVDGRLQLHALSQLAGHALTDLTGATFKLPLLHREHAVSHTCSHTLDFQSFL